MDDADGRAHDVESLLNSLAERKGLPVIRAVLIARNGAGLRAALVALLAPGNAWIAAGATMLEVGPQGGQDDRKRWFGEAVEKLAVQLGEPVPKLPEVFPADWDPMSFVMMQALALATILDLNDKRAASPTPAGATAATAAVSAAALSPGNAAERLMIHEKHRWRTVAPAWNFFGGDDLEMLAQLSDVQAPAITALALLGAENPTDAVAVLRRVPDLRDEQTMRLRAIAAAVTKLYPAGPGGAPRIRPDVIGEWFVVNQLTKDPDLAQGLHQDLTDDQAARALGMLARAADSFKPAAHLFEEFLGGDVRRQILAATMAAKTGRTGQQLLDRVVAEQLASTQDLTLEQLNELDRLIPTHAMLHTHAAIAGHTVAWYRNLAATDASDHQVELASSLDRFGDLLNQVGRFEEALNATEEAVSLFRSLAEADPARIPGLARALTTLGVEFQRLGRFAEALTPASEAVTLLQSLAETDPTCTLDLARALNSLATRYDQLGRSKEALDTAKASVSVLRTLNDADPSRSRVALPKH